MDFEDNAKDKNSDISITNNINPMIYANLNKDFYITNPIKFILLNKVIISSNINSNDLIKQLCNSYMKNKYTKVVKYKKMTKIT